ncbi:MAG: EamA family transporter [Cephaloticoccus sp.]|nr:EamA family transporter [Cephaloticoccus sp.]MCF7760632.1 EamA family transporter [Cephaloticoccus sp.]
MLLLLLTSLVWAFSYGLIKGQLTGIDATAVAVLRLLCAALLFMPFLRLRLIPRRHAWRLAVIGALQFGIMYVLYLHAYHYLQAHEVVLFTIFTPVYIALLDSALERRWFWRHMLAAFLALVGAGIILWKTAPGSDIAVGFILMQFSNLCFAAGQLAWRRERLRLAEFRERDVFGLLYVGAVGAALLLSGLTTDWLDLRLTIPQIGVILYLGIIASGIGFFWWNLGATRVNPGTLAVMNNAKIPVGIVVSLFFFGEHANLPRLILSGVIMLIAIGVAENWFGPPQGTTGKP